MEPRRDALKRQYPSSPISSGRPFSYLPRDIEVAFEPLNWFGGALGSKHLIAHARALGWSEQTTRERLKMLVAEQNTPHKGPYLELSRRQFPDLPNGFIPRGLPLFYSETPRSRAVLAEHRRLATSYNGGHYHHNCMRAHYLHSLWLAAHADPKATYVPQHLALPDKPISAFVDIEHAFDPKKAPFKKTVKLITDRAFIMEFPEKRRFHMVEIDRSTETVGATSLVGESWLRKALSYGKLIGSGAFREHYGLPPNVGAVLLVATTSTTQEELILKLIHRLSGPAEGCNFIATTVVPECDGPSFLPPAPDLSLYSRPYRRAGRPPFFINREIDKPLAGDPTDAEIRQLHQGLELAHWYAKNAVMIELEKNRAS